MNSLDRFHVRSTYSIGMVKCECCYLLITSLPMWRQSRNFYQVTLLVYQSSSLMVTVVDLLSMQYSHICKAYYYQLVFMVTWSYYQSVFIVGLTIINQFSDGNLTMELESLSYDTPVYILHYVQSMEMNSNGIHQIQLRTPLKKLRKDNSDLFWTGLRKKVTKVIISFCTKRIFEFV